MKRRRKNRILLFIFTLLAAIVFTFWQLAGNRPDYSTSVTIRPVSESSIIPGSVKTEVAPKPRSKSLRRPTMSSEFSDKQPIQLAVALEKGIEPISDIKAANRVKLPIRHITPNDAYDIDTLKHSLPYLQPDAAEVLTRIGSMFADSVQSRTGHRSRIRVTSVLRTEGSVARLRRLNRNAVENSTHRYGRTFDISYRNFTPDDTTHVLNSELGKNILAGVLRKLRNDSLIYVKYEVKQGCFHITTR